MKLYKKEPTLEDMIREVTRKAKEKKSGNNTGNTSVYGEEDGDERRASTRLTPSYDDYER